MLPLFSSAYSATMAFESKCSTCFNAPSVIFSACGSALQTRCLTPASFEASKMFLPCLISRCLSMILQKSVTPKTPYEPLTAVFTDSASSTSALTISMPVSLRAFDLPEDGSRVMPRRLYFSCRSGRARKMSRTLPPWLPVAPNTVMSCLEDIFAVVVEDWCRCSSLEKSDLIACI